MARPCCCSELRVLSDDADRLSELDERRAVCLAARWYRVLSTEAATAYAGSDIKGKLVVRVHSANRQSSACKHKRANALQESVVLMTVAWYDPGPSTICSYPL